MFNLLKKKYKEIKDYPDTWSVSKGEHDGKIVSVRFRSLKDAIGHTQYPYQIGVAVGFQVETENGLPEQKDSDELLKIEDNIVELLEKQNQCVFALALTTNNMREFVFYTGEWKPEFFDKEIALLQEKLSPYKLNFMMQEDREWNTFKTFCK